MRFALPLATVLALSACAGQPGEGSGRVLDRLPAGAVRPVASTEAPLSVETVARLAREGLTVEAFIARLQGMSGSLRLSAADVLALAAAGVPPAVIDHLLERERRALHDQCSEQINRRESDAAQSRQEAEALCRRRCDLACPPFYGGHDPYYPYRRRWP